MKKLLAVLIAMCVCIGMAPMAFAGGLHFTDVPNGAWYYDDLQSAYTEGLINGKTATEFKPNDNMTYAEAIKLAACMHQRDKEGSVSIANGNPWYQPYVDYCKKNEIISEFANYDYNAPATRAQYMNIFANALPKEKLQEINEVPMDSIPDYNGSNSFAEEVYLLYRAGIVGGVDAQHNCKPDTNIKRSEVATILARMMFQEKRIKFSMGTTSTETETKSESGDKMFSGGSASVDTGKPTPAPVVKEEYDPLVIVTQPAKIENASVNSVLEYTVEVDGGKAPYTYSWMTRSRYDQGVAMEESDNVAGVNAKTLVMVYTIDNKYSDSTFYCVVTDARGETVKSRTVSMPEAFFIMSPNRKIENSQGTIVTGRISSGILRKGDTILVRYNDEGLYGTATVEKIEMFGKSLDEASAGNNVGVLLGNYKKIQDASFIGQYFSGAENAKLQELGNFIVKVPFKAELVERPCGDDGETVKLQVDVLGGQAPYSYEWLYITSNMEYLEPVPTSRAQGVNAPTLSLKVSREDFVLGAYYICKVTDATGKSVYGDMTGISPRKVIYITRWVEDATGYIGDEVTFSTNAVGRWNLGINYQWQVKTDNHADFVDIEPVDTWASGANTKELTIRTEKADFISNAQYRCVITNGETKSVTNVGKVVSPLPIVTLQPQDTTAQNEEWVKFNVSAVGGCAPYKYEWQYSHKAINGAFTPITEGYSWAKGADTSELSVQALIGDEDSNITYRCKITDAKGNVTYSQAAKITLKRDGDGMIVLVG